MESAHKPRSLGSLRLPSGIAPLQPAAGSARFQAAAGLSVEIPSQPAQTASSRYG